MTQSLVPLIEVQPSRPVYLWPNRIPLGSLTIVEGPPGSNKSTVLYDIAARVTRGLDMPNCTVGLPASSVIILQAEDDPAATIRPNLEAMGADIQRVFIWGKQATPIKLPDDIDFIASQIAKLHARLVIIDPITTFLRGNANSDQSIRQSLGPLVTVAEQEKAAVVLVRHFKKSNTSDPLYRGAGSIALAGLARSVIQVGHNPKDADQRVVVQVKASLNALAKSLAFRPVPVSGGLTVEWLGVSDCSAMQLHEAAREQDRTALREAQYVLFSILAEGPVLAKEAKTLGADAGITPRTLRRAKESLGVVSQRRGFGPRSRFFWMLPEESELVDRLKENELDNLLDNLIHGADDAVPDDNDQANPADWWKQARTDDDDVDGQVV